MKRVVCLVERKAHQEERKRPAFLKRGKIQADKEKLRRVEKEKAAYVAKSQDAQQEWRRSSVEELRK